MSLAETYNTLKLNDKEKVILLKSGAFYTTFADDAYLLNYLFQYQINRDKLGFPKSSLGKVLRELEDKHINYSVCENTNIIEDKVFNDNKYTDYRNKTRKQKFDKQMEQLLIERIEYLIQENRENYDKIKRFIDEF